MVLNVYHGIRFNYTKHLCFQNAWMDSTIPLQQPGVDTVHIMKLVEKIMDITQEVVTKTKGFLYVKVT